MMLLRRRAAVSVASVLASIVLLSAVLSAGAFVAAGAFLAAGCRLPVPPSQGDEAVLVPVVIDTDMATDDWLAILFLLQRRDVEVKAICVTGAGEARVGPGVTNALGLATLAGRPQTPVAGGRETPLRGNHTFPIGWRDAVDSVLGVALPRAQAQPSPLGAPELLASTVSASPRKVVIVALGNLTNVAEAILEDPGFLANVEMIYVMGGAVRVPGNLGEFGAPTGNTFAEWNFYVDPYAASVVLGSGAPVTLVPLDAANDVPVTTAFFERLAAERASPEAEFAYQVYEQLQPLIRGGRLYFWDPLAAAIAVDGTLATFEDLRLMVVTEEGSRCGQTVIDDDGAPVRTATSADKARFETVFLTTLNRTGP